MFRSIVRGLGHLALATVLSAGLGAVAHAQDSGYLKDYSQLTLQKDPLGIERRVWVSPDLTAGMYQKALVEKVTFFPKAQPSDRVPQKSLTEIENYLDSSLRNAIGSVVPLVDKPGPGVIRVRVAITAASVETGLKPYQLIPAALIFTAAMRASGEAKYDVKLAVESEFSDSVSGAPLARGVRDANGIEVKGDEKLTLSLAKPKIDEWAESVQKSLAERLNK